MSVSICVCGEEEFKLFICRSCSCHRESQLLKLEIPLS